MKQEQFLGCVDKGEMMNRFQLLVLIYSVLSSCAAARADCEDVFLYQAADTVELEFPSRQTNTQIQIDAHIGESVVSSVDLPVVTDPNPGWVWGRKASHVGEPGITPLLPGTAINLDVQLKHILGVTVENLIFDERFRMTTWAELVIQMEVEIPNNAPATAEDLVAYIPMDRSVKAFMTSEKDEPVLIQIGRLESAKKAGLHGILSRLRMTKRTVEEGVRLLAVVRLPLINGIHQKSKMMPYKVPIRVQGSGDNLQYLDVLIDQKENDFKITFGDLGPDSNRGRHTVLNNVLRFLRYGE